MCFTQRSDKKTKTKTSGHSLTGLTGEHSICNIEKSLKNTETLYKYVFCIGFCVTHCL